MAIEETSRGVVVRRLLAPTNVSDDAIMGPPAEWRGVASKVISATTTDTDPPESLAGQRE
jgi:hypothetical protein